MKQFIIAIVVLMFSAPAFAAESWAADGIQSVTASNAGTVANYMPFGRGGFETESLCNDFIIAQKTLALSNNSAGKGTVRKIDADCSLVRDIAAPE